MELDYTFDRRLELQREEAREEGLQEGIIAYIHNCREFKLTKEDTVARIVKEFHISDTQAAEYVEPNWE